MVKFVLFLSAFFLVCGLLVAQQGGKELSVETKRSISEVRAELMQRVARQPLSLEELTDLLARRYGKAKEEDALISLLRLERIVLDRVVDLNPFYKEEVKREKKRVEYEELEFDVSDIVTAPPDYAAPRIALWRYDYPGPVPIIPVGGDETVGSIAPEVLEQLIYKAASDDTTNGEVEVEYRKGRLICRIPKDKVNIVKDLIEKIRNAILKDILIEVKFIKVEPEYYFLVMGGEPAKQSLALTAEQEKRLLVDGVEAGKVEEVVSGKVTARNGQTIALNVGKQHAILFDYDINTTGMPTLQPVVELLNVGLICEFRPLLSGDGKEVRLRVLGSYTVLREPIRKTMFDKGELFMPQIETFVTQTMVRLKPGQAALISGALNIEGDTEEKKQKEHCLLYLKTTVSAREKN